MTKIKNYPLDLEVNGGDKWIGTDSQSLAKLTKNFTPDNLAKYYNDKEVVESVNQLRFFYDTVDPGDDRASGSFSFQTEVGPTVPFSSISSLVFSKYTMGNDAVNNFMTDIVNSVIIIQKADNPNIYAFYALNSYEIDPLDGDFYNVVLTYSSGTGSIEEDQDYFVSLIQFAGAAGIQTILGSEFIDSSFTGIGEVTLSLSATGDSTSLTGLRGDNTWGTLGLEALDEGGRNSFGNISPPIGRRLVGRDPANFGPIGQDSIDFSSGYYADVTTLPFGGSITMSPQIGSSGPGTITIGNTNENNTSGGTIFGPQNVNNGGPNIEPTYAVGTLINGSLNQNYGLNYYNLISGYKNLIGDRNLASWSAAGFPYPYPVQYWSGQIGMYNQMPSGFSSVQLGYGLLSGGPFCTTVGIGNEDVTLSIASNLSSSRNNLNPRFVVGVGTFTGETATPGVGTRANGFVVMSDGTATFPVLSNIQIDSAGADSAVTKGWVQAQTDINTTYDLASSQSGADVDLTLTGSDASVDTLKLVSGANVTITDDGSNNITIATSGIVPGAESIQIEVKNTSGGTLLKGTPVYITGTVGASIRAEISAADSSMSSAMPAVGLLAQDLLNNADGFAITGGFLSNVTTDPIDGLTPTPNNTIYVKPGGGLTLTKPTGSNLIQNIAKVGKVSGGSAGSLIVSSILRTNDVPNLTEGKIWVGTAVNTSESSVVHLDEGNGRMGIGTDSPSQKLHVDGSARVTGAYYDSGNTPGAANQLLASTATGTAWIDPSTIVAEAATLVVIACKNTSGADIAQGTPVYQTGTVGATATIEIAPADALISANKLPAIGLLQTALNNNGFGFVVITGELTNFTTSPIDGVVPTTGDKVFVKSGGGLTLTKPTGEGNGIQNMGLVGKVSGGNSGSITVSSIMRTNDVPNLPLGRLFVGTNTNTSLTSDVVYIDDANSNVGIGTTSPTNKLDILSDIAGAGGISVTNTNTGGTATSSVIVTNGTAGRGGALNYIHPTYTAFPVLTNYLDLVAYSQTSGFIIRTSGTGNIKFLQGGITAANERFTINANDVIVNTGSSNVDFRVKGLSGDVLFVDASAGNVGIGTTSPDYKLDVAGDVRIESTSALNFGGTAAASSTWQLQTANAQADFQIGETQTGPRMYFESGGAVGIGNTAPAQKLHVSGNIRVGTTADNVFSNKFTALGNVDVELSSNAGHNLLLNSTSGDNVGVGTPTPQAKLDVAGGIKMSDDASAAASTNVGTLRYRADANNSYVDMCMQTGASTYVWVNIVQNNW